MKYIIFIMLSQDNKHFLTGFSSDLVKSMDLLYKSPNIRTDTPLYKLVKFSEYFDFESANLKHDKLFKMTFEKKISFIKMTNPELKDLVEMQ